MPTEHLFPYVSMALSDMLRWHWYSLLSTQILLGRGTCQQSDCALLVSNVKLLIIRVKICKNIDSSTVVKV